MLLAAGAASAIPAGSYQVVAVPTTAARVATARPAAARVSRPSRPVANNPSALEPIVQIGTIEIPKIGLVHPIFNGITMRNIDQGPSHWPGTAFPGEAGNAVFAGHRVTHTHPFLRIAELQPGDKVIFTIQGVRSVYVMTSSEVVTPQETQIVRQTSEPTATLFACHPPHSAKYRYVVHLALSS